MVFGRVNLHDQPFMFQAFGAEIQQDAQPDSCRLEVVQHLSNMLFGDGFSGLEFQENCLIDYDVGEIVADNFSRIVYLNGLLLFDAEVLFSEFEREGILVDFLQESGAEGVPDLHGSANDPVTLLFED